MANQISDEPMVKSVGASGQISLGKAFSVKQVLIESPAKGVWIIRTATIIPDSSRPFSGGLWPRLVSVSQAM